MQDELTSYERSHASPVTWARVDRDFFVASAAGTFLGTIDRESEGLFVARDMRSMVIGSHSTLQAAMAAVTQTRPDAGPGAL